MIVLGYSGLDGAKEYKKTKDIISGEERIIQGLDSAAAIIKDGEIIAAVSEERFNLEKQTNKFPINSIKYCLKETGINLDDVDYICHSFDYESKKVLLSRLDKNLFESVYDIEIQFELFKKNFETLVNKEKFISVEHHLSHAASAFYPSGFDKALCVVCDAMGESNSISIYKAEENNFKLLDKISIRDSLGILYSVVTHHLGFAFNADEYKVMGLAPYGNAEKFRDFFEDLVELRDNGKIKIKWISLGVEEDENHRNKIQYLNSNVIEKRGMSSPILNVHKDFAAATQEILEKSFLHIVKYWANKTGLKKLCMAGGVALNCTNNGKIIKSGLFNNIYIQPASGDDGSALGAALYYSNKENVNINKKNIQQIPFYGPEYSDEECEQIFKEYEDKINVIKLESIDHAAKDAASEVAKDKIIAWFQGRMEYGPRALGNRTIIANPTTVDIQSRLNRIIKMREGFRPFAPASLKEKADLYFDMILMPPFDYMLATCYVKEEYKKMLPGITHVDGSARVQTVSKEGNFNFYKLINYFGEISSIYCIVNTSFNIKDQPIIVSPNIAIETFLKINLDTLYINRFKIIKK